MSSANTKRRFLIGILEYVLCFALTFVFAFSDLLYSLDSALKDTVYQSPRGINNTIKIIAIDDKTLDALGHFGR